MLKVDIQQFYDMLDKGHLLTFERAHDTKRVLEVLPKRFAKYGLRLHPDKTRLFPFHRPGIGHRASGDGRRVAARDLVQCASTCRGLPIPGHAPAKATGW